MNDHNYGAGLLRVSSLKQGLIGDSPKDQKNQIKYKAISKNAEVKKWFTLIVSASGEFQPSQEVIDYCKDPKNKIKYLFIKSIDRFTRGGAASYFALKKQLEQINVSLIDVQGVISGERINTLAYTGIKFPWSVYSPSTTSELLTAERAKDEVRDILTRLIGAEIAYTRLGYWTKPAPAGYKNVKIDTLHGKRVVLEPHEIESSWFIAMFTLRANNIFTDEEIIKKINAMGYKSRKRTLRDKKDGLKIIGHNGCVNLTVKQLQKYIRNPIYCGVINNNWTIDKPVKAQFEGLVAVELWNRANKGKIIITESKNEIKIYKGSTPKWQQVKQKNNPFYAYKYEVSCPICTKPLLGSASKGQSGQHFPVYHCSRYGHKRYHVPKTELEITIKNFVKQIKFNDAFKKRIREIATKEYELIRAELNKESINHGKYVLELEQEKQAIIEKIKILTHPSALVAMQEELDKIDIKLKSAIEQRNKKEYQEIDINVAISYVMFYMEHFKELLLEQPDLLKRARLFGLIFDSSPTYEELKNGTPKLACLFELNNSYVSSKNQSVNWSSQKWNSIYNYFIKVYHTFEQLQIPVTNIAYQ